MTPTRVPWPVGLRVRGAARAHAVRRNPVAERAAWLARKRAAVAEMVAAADQAVQLQGGRVELLERAEFQRRRLAFLDWCRSASVVALRARRRALEDELGSRLVSTVRAGALRRAEISSASGDAIAALSILDRLLPAGK